MSADRNELADEADRFWRLSWALQKAQLDRDCIEIAEVLDELDVLALHAESVRIRRMCRGQIAAAQTDKAAPGSAA